MKGGNAYMIIDSSAVAMSSRHGASQKYDAKRLSQSAVIQTGGSPGISVNNPANGFFNMLNYSVDNKGRNKENNSKSTARETGIVSGITDGSDPLESYRQTLKFQFDTINYLLRLLFGEKMPDYGSSSSYAASAGENTSSGGAMRVTTQTQTFTYEEAEETSFSTTGCVRTADGREIEFGIEMSMSRSFYAQYSESFSRVEPELMDPLVINLDGNVTGVSDQKFFFDLDADGTEEEIYSLSSASGFLALDKNEDGIINNGSELFGTKSGNGFKELGQYDLDKNGWIDEADEIFKHLKVWTKDDDGNDRLFTLKEAGVGAICLKAAGTEFKLADQSNATKAQIRSSGFFLHENGVPGLVQQLDMAM